MDLDTFLTTLYVVIDDWYNAEMKDVMRRGPGPRPKLSDSEVLTLVIAAQWRTGVPWHSERGLVRYMQAHGRQWFPGMLGKSAFNARARQLCLALVALQQSLARMVSPGEQVYEVADGLPLPVCSVSQAQREPRRWLMQTSRGHGGTGGGWFVGQRWWVSVTAEGAITGWMVAAGHINERWLLEAFLSQRAGDGCIYGPPPNTHQPVAERPLPPGGFLGAAFAVGSAPQLPYITDRGLNGRRWRDHWRETFHADVIAVPPPNTPEYQTWTPRDCRWVASRRQIIETVFAVCETVLGIKRIQAHSQWGQYTRLAAKAAALNMGLWLNKTLARPLHALATLVC